MTAIARAAVDHLARPAHRHDLTTDGRTYSEELLAELDQLHLRCLGGVNEPIDAGAALLEVTAAGRIAFIGGARSADLVDADLVDAVVHAARAGYRLCLSRSRPQSARNFCWLPARHSGDCEHRGWWRWSLLYGYRGPVTVVCTSCTPHRHVPVPEHCPHR